MDFTKMDKGLQISKLIKCDSRLLLLLLLLLLTGIVSCSQGSNSFGFDSANSCSPNSKVSRRGRAQMLAAIPCDLAKQPFCHLPGSIYPWHAVRRFVHENQGLMKRMYGDVRHISILRDEIQNNEVVDVDSMEEAAQRYSKMPRGAKYMLHGRDADRDEFSNYKGNDVLMEPHFRPVSTTSPTTTTTPTTPATPTTPITTSFASTEPTVAAIVHLGEEQPSVESNSVYEVANATGVTATTTTTTLATTTKTTTTTVRSKQTSADELPNNNMNNIDNPQPEVVQGPRNFTSNPLPGTPAPASKATATPLSSHKQKVNENATTTSPAIDGAASASSSTAQTKTTAATATSSIAATTATLSSNNNNISGSSLVPRRNVTKTILGATTPASFASLFSPTFTSLIADKQRKPGAPGGPGSSTTSTPASATKAGLLREGGQLFQDAMKQEPMAVTSNMRGVNACPVKDEVVAPFWANNTRGEVLALLNLYPFEQYVHWEKCTQEFKQMFCRDGCRCEQQYRLHRLLAYDPHNECRGIFSDWFRFPSSCICKCYNIPMEFRATSRSPRSDSSFDATQSQSHPQPHLDPIDAAETEVQRAIYEHATDQWYRPRDEYDFFEG
ncbi:protein spaetzle 4 [Drosophila mojavensis]|uniref:protein spaetzle 4 n=1 Tax=Drosophila mojavensis TaxID=7230 RepID=UPI0013EE4649|nr:protein spaetzle 4 [Drosophila mojavensis]